MVTRILGVGAGVFCIATVWVVALFAAFVCSKLKRPTSYIGIVGILVASIVTAVLLCIPREKADEEYEPYTEHQDIMFIWRTSLLVFMGLSLLLGGIIMISEYLAVPVTAMKLQNSRRGIVRLKPKS